MNKKIKNCDEFLLLLLSDRRLNVSSEIRVKDSFSVTQMSVHVKLDRVTLCCSSSAG